MWQFDPEGKTPKQRGFTLETDVAALGRVLDDMKNPKLVVIDPVTAFCGRTDSHKNAEVRGLLAPLASLAAKHHVAIVAVTHLNKGSSSNALYRAMGSLAFVAAARGAHVVTTDQADDSRRLVLPIKNNLGPEQAGLAYSIRDDGGGPVVWWDADPVTVTAAQALSQPEQEQPAPATDEAAAFLRELLADGMPHATKDIQLEAKSAGMSWATVRRAKDLGRAGEIIVARHGGSGGTWYWKLEDGPGKGA